ncbi:cell division protein FtsL [bacterium BMS3Bbin02]|nr:cell division protein FtsL [bacterium BMS3Bbin02]
MTARPAPRSFPVPGAETAVGLGHMRKTVRDVQPFVIFSLLVVIAFFASISSRVSLDTKAFELEELESSINAEQARYFDLQLELARLQAPDQILDRALAMGMVYPTDRTIVEVQLSSDLVEGDEYRWAELKALLSAQP